MARKKIHEYHGKHLLTRHLLAKGVPLGGAASVNTTPSCRAVQITSSDLRAAPTPVSHFSSLADANPWLHTSRLVVKPDMLFGQRGKNSLVLLDADYAAAQQFITQRMDTSISVSGVTGILTTFLIEPFVPHTDEFYLSIQTVRHGDRLSFAACGGVDIEENWDAVHSVVVPSGEPEVPVSISDAHILPLLEGVSPNLKSTLVQFLMACFQTYVDLDMTLLEMNPFTVKELQPAILDARVELDSYAAFKNARAWGRLEFPHPWGRVMSKEERSVEDMDARSGASLKLAVLNPSGRMWTMVAGGGASVIYSDQVVQLGFGDELGNYAEYSGNPKREETYLYARTLLSLVTAAPDGRRRALLCGGGVANFSDVAATFGGLQQALTDFHGKLQMAKVKVFVRRGGPNYKAGLQIMRELGETMDIPIDVYGPEENMTNIVALGIRWINEGY